MGEEMVERALAALGMGFDLTADFRLRFAKGWGAGGRGRRRLVELDEGYRRDVTIPGGFVVRGVPRDVGCDKGDHVRYRTDVLQFCQMSELLNKKSSIQGKVPSGYFNALFDLSGVWLDDAMDSRSFAFDGYFISLYNLHLMVSPLVLCEEVKKAVPSKWNPLSLSRFIKNYGTHIIVGLSVGGQDVVCVRQRHSSPISLADLKVHLEDLGDFLFSDGRSPSPLQRKTREGKNKVPDVFNKILQPNSLQLSIHTETSSKDGLTIICSKIGGDVHARSHYEWLQRVGQNPDVILFKFVPITSLLAGIPGGGYLSHAINLYLRYKPAPEELQYFLEFQVPQQWAPMFNELTLGPQRRKSSFQSLTFRCLGPKLLVNVTQVTTDKKPVIGLRLFLEGKKCNRLAIHVQHLSSIPSIFDTSKCDASTSSERWPCQWQECDDSDSRHLETIQWKGYSCVCTASVRYDPKWLDTVSNGVFIVTGAQLIAKGRWTSNLHLRLLFTHLPNCSIQKTRWATAPVATHKSSFLTNLSTTFTREPPHHHTQEKLELNSSVFTESPPVPVQSRTLLKYVDVTEVVQGPHDVPGHWLVIAARLVKEGGKIGLHVKFALLNYLI